MSKLALVHNLSESDLRFSQAWLGGLACPSFAVVDTRFGLESFGDITLVMSPEDHDFRRFPAHTADVYTQRIPSAQFIADKDKLMAIYDKVSSVIPEGILHQALHTLNYRMTEDYSDGLETVRDHILYNVAARYAFLLDKGYQVDIPAKETEAPYPFLKDEALVAEIKEMMPIIWGSDEAKMLAAKVKAYNDERVSVSSAPVLLGKALNKAFYENKDGSINTDSLRPLVFEDTIKHLQQSGPVLIDEYELMKGVDKIFSDDPSLKSAFEADVTEQLQDVFHSPYFHEKTRSNGKAKHTPFTLSNVTRYLKKQANNSDSKGFSGAGAVRALLADEMKSLRSIESHRGMLSNKEDFGRVKDQTNDYFSSLPEKLSEYYRFESDSFHYRGDCYDMIETFAKTGSPRVLDEGYHLDEIPNEIIHEIKDFFQKLKYEKTEYFEVNVKDEVSFDQFAYALVPDDCNQETRDILSKIDITVIEYDHTVPNARRDILANELLDCQFGKDVPSVDNARDVSPSL